MKFRPYSEYKDSGVEWFGKIPKEWDISILGAHISTIVPMRDKPTSFDGNIPWIRIEDFEGKFISDSKSGQKVSKEMVQEMNLKIFPINTVLCSCSCNMGVTAIVKNPLISNQTFIGLVAGSTLAYEYLFYLMQVAKKHLNYLATGAIQLYLSKNDFQRLRIPFPKIEEQYRIASFLDKKTSEIDLTIEKDTLLIELLKEKRTALINHVVTKGLDPTVKMKDSGVEWIGEIPEEWEVVPLTKFLESKSDYRGKTPEKVEEGVFLVTGKNIKEGKIDYELSKEYVPEDQYDTIMHRGKPKIGDLLFTTEAPLGEVANVDFPRIALAQRIIKMRGKNDILDNYFLKYYMMSETFQGHLQRLATGSTALGIKASKLLILRLILPPYSEQLEIVNNLEESISKFDRIIQKIQQNIELLKEYKKSLIHHVVTGKVDVREVAV